MVAKAAIAKKALPKCKMCIRDRSSPYHALAEKYLPNGSCGVVSFGLAGGREAASTFMKELKLAAIETHVADARTCCLNPASSTHRQMKMCIRDRSTPRPTPTRWKRYRRQRTQAPRHCRL